MDDAITKTAPAHEADIVRRFREAAAEMVRQGMLLAGSPDEAAPHTEIIAALNKGQAHAVLVAEFTPWFTVRLQLVNPRCYYDDEAAIWEVFRYASERPAPLWPAEKVERMPF